MKIKQMMVILFIVLSAIPLSILGMTNMTYYNGKLERLLENDLWVAVSTQARGIENFMEERKTDADILTNSRLVKELLAQDNMKDGEIAGRYKDPLVDLMELRVQSNRFVEGITILDRNFRVVLCSEDLPVNVEGIKNLDASYFGPELKFTHVINGVCNPRKKIVAAVEGIYDGGELQGYLFMELNLDFFEEIRNSAKLFNNGSIYLIDDRGQMIAAGDTVSAADRYVLSADERSDFSRAWENRDAKAREGVLRYEARGSRYMSCYMLFDRPGWKLISSINVDEVLQMKRGVRDLFLLIGSTLVVLLVVINYFVRRYISIPIHTMIDKFKKIQETGDYSIRMGQSADNEIGIISRGIDNLLASIENYLEQEKREQESLRSRAERDPMTGLFNKETMAALLKLELERMRGERCPVACLFLDLDDFKNFNSEYGHAGGDRVLKFVADTLKAYFPGMAGRQGGDEFIAVVSGRKQTEDMEQRIQEILEILNTGIDIQENGVKVSVRCSIGAVLSAEGEMCWEDMIERSDEAMYEVKRRDKNGYLIWKSS